MRRWSEIAEQVAATPRTSEKTALLAAFLAALPPDDLPVAAVFLTGRPFPGADPRTTGLGWRTLARAVEEATGADPALLARAYDRTSDGAAAVALALAEAGHAPDPASEPTLAEVRDAFAAIEAAGGPAAKAAVLAGLLRRSSPATAAGIVKVLGGDLRIGLREGLLEAAIAQAFGRPAADVRRAAMLTADVGRTALLAREDRLAEAGLELFRPVRCMLASPAEDTEAILRRLGPEVWVEDKYDGIRCQLHRRDDEVRLYSRDLRDVTAAFPEVAAGARDLPWCGVLDGEILAWRDGTVLPFLQLQARLGRVAPPPDLLARVPVIFVAWDALALGPRDGPAIPLLDAPLRERRARLEGLHLPMADAGGRFALSRLTTARSVEELEAAFAEARARRNEGLLVKDPASPYLPGRRGLGWLKLKRALATLDCVVVGVEGGHGKRHGVLSDFTFAVRDEATGGLVTIGKAYTGLTDAELAALTRWFEDHTVSTHGRYRAVEPAVVVEVAFDALMRSARHRSGFALRFPRIVRVRDDRGPDAIDTLATVRRLHGELQAGAEHLVTLGARARGSGTPG